MLTETRTARPARLIGIAAVAIIGLVCVLAAATSSAWTFDAPFDTTPRTPKPPTLPTAEQSTPPPATSQPPLTPPAQTAAPSLTWLVILLAVIALLVVAFAVIRLIAWLRRPRQVAPEKANTSAGAAIEAEPEFLAEALRSASQNLQPAGVPRDEIIAAWVEIEAAAGRSGLPRSPSQTPEEHVRAVLEHTGANRQASRAMLALYLRARFSAHEPSRADLERAGTILATLADSWPGLRDRGEAVGPLETDNAPIPCETNNGSSPRDPGTDPGAPEAENGQER